MMGGRVGLGPALAHFETHLLPLALQEDVGAGDLTTEGIVTGRPRGLAVIDAKDELVVCGLSMAEAVFRTGGEGIRIIRHLAKDGDTVSRGSVVMEVEGDLALLLTLERTALNVLQRLSGIASRTRTFVRELEGSRTVLLDTRKTAAGWRLLEKYAVATGGGANHRLGLHDMVLIKDNHIEAAGGITEAMRRVRRHLEVLPLPRPWIEVECESLGQVEEALSMGADVIMLDNMDDARIRQAVVRAEGRCKLEVSGNITAGRLPVLARLGVDFISSGAITHSAPAKDLSMTLKRMSA